MYSIHDCNINTAEGKHMACDDDEVSRWVAPLDYGVGDDHVEPLRVGRRMSGIHSVVRRPAPTQAPNVTDEEPRSESARFVEITKKNGKTVMKPMQKKWNDVAKPLTIMLPPNTKETKRRTKNKPVDKRACRSISTNVQMKQGHNTRRGDTINCAKYQVLIYLRVAYRDTYSIETLDQTACLITAHITSFLSDDTAEGSPITELTINEQLVKRQMQREYQARLRVINREAEEQIEAINEYFGSAISFGPDNKEIALATVECQRQNLIRRLNDRPEITYEEHNFVEERTVVKQSMKRYHLDMDDIGYYN